MQAGKPGVSVIIPTYNRAHDLLRALRSLQQQTYTNWEAIVIDNHSIDNTDEVVASFKDDRISFHKIHNNGVIAASRNKGFNLANAELIALLDSDDWWTNDKLEKSVKLINEGYDLVYHDMWLVKSRNWLGIRRKIGSWDLETPVFDDLIKRGNPIPNSSVVVRTALIRSLNGLSEDTQLVTTEDYDCWLRLSKITDRFKCLPEVLGYYWVGDNISSNPARQYEVIKRLSMLYVEPYIEKNEMPVPSWMLYIKARAAYLLGEKEEALDLLKILRKRSLSLIIRLKVQVMLFYLQMGLYNRTRVS